MGKRLPPVGFAEKDVENRRAFLRKCGQPFTQAQLDAPEDYRGLAENQVGYLSLPVCVSGPLQLQGEHARGLFYVPLCALEGTLVLSMTRGFYLTFLSGGMRARHICQHMNRSPLFMFESLEQGARFSRWVDNRFEEIRAVAQQTTRHGKLLRIEQRAIHTRIVLNFVYETGDASGQNMVTIATHAACEWIRSQCPEPIRGYLIESNYSGDKNASWQNFHTGRGHQVIVETLLRPRPLKRLLRVDWQQFVAYDIDKNIGGHIGGLAGSNVHAVNALTALYLATGQDVAGVAENAGCSAFYEHIPGEGILATLRMPGAAVGTVGGATRLKQQQANLEMLGCAGAGGAKKLAEIICASVLALEVSLLGAIASDEFTESHRKYGRQKQAAES